MMTVTQPQQKMRRRIMETLKKNQTRQRLLGPLHAAVLAERVPTAAMAAAAAALLMWRLDSCGWGRFRPVTPRNA